MSDEEWKGTLKERERMYNFLLLDIKKYEKSLEFWKSVPDGEWQRREIHNLTKLIEEFKILISRSLGHSSTKIEKDLQCLPQS